MMTIAMIGQKGLPARSGGIEHHVEALAGGLVERGYRVVVFGRPAYVGSALPPAGIEQICTRGIATKSLDALTHSFTALLAARAIHPDIIHIHGVGIALLAPLARLIHPRAKLVVTFHCMDRLYDKWGPIAKMAFRLGEWFTCCFAHEVVTVSQELTRYCATEYGRRSSYISHAFRFDRPARQADAEARVRALGLEPYRYFLFVGRLLPHKGAHRFLRAFQAASDRFPERFADLRAAVVGGSSFTDAYAADLRAVLKAMPQGAALGERFGAELRAIQACALAHVFPTTGEGLSLAVLEAAASGRPILMHDLEANREATGGYARSIDTLSEEGFVQGLADIAQASEADLRAEGEALAAFVAYAFSPERHLDAADRLYRELVSEEGELVIPPPPRVA